MFVLTFNYFKSVVFLSGTPFALLQDFCEVCTEKLPNYEEKMKNFDEEHIHTDEEIRYCVAGSGKFVISFSLLHHLA